MKKLYSYLTYVSLGLFPFLFIFLIVSMNRQFKFTLAYFLSNDLILVILLITFIFIYIKFKRVYLKNSSLYIYDLFSNKHDIVTKQNLIGIGRFIPFNPFGYKISFVDDNGRTKTVYFIRNLFIFNMNDALRNLAQ